MAKKSVSLFRRLNRLFKSGPKLRKKINTSDTTVTMPDNSKSSGMLLLQKSSSPSYASLNNSAYNLSERLMRYQDFCEMEYTPELASAMDIFSEEAVPQDEKGRILHVYSENEKIKEILEDLYYNVLNVDYNLRPQIRNLCKYGDFFLYLDISPEYGVMNAFPIPVNEIEREENYDKEDPFAVRFRWTTLGNKTLENWELAHFRLLGNDMFLPYGSSMLEPARRIWRQLILIEDAMLVYRVVRAPERRVFYIDVGNLSAEEVDQYMEKQKHQLRSNQVIDHETGRVDMRYNALSTDEDYWLPTRGQDSGTKIDTLAGGQNTAAVEDVEYIQKKMIGALKIPRAYLGYEDALSSKATLAQEDIRFARTINAIQKTVISELNKIAIIHLYAHGFSGDELLNFSIHLTSPSTIAEQQKLELWRSRFEIASSVPEGMLKPEWILKNILNMTDKEIRENFIGNQDQTGGTGGGSMGGGGGIDLDGGDFDLGDTDSEDSGDFDLGDTDSSSDDEEELKSGVEPEEEETDVELITSGEDQAKGQNVPINTIAKRKHARQVRRKRHGNADIHMPDFAKMVKPTTISGNVYDNDFFRTMSKPDTITPLKPVKEGVNTMSCLLSLSPDIVSMLSRFDNKFEIALNNKSKLLHESIEDVQDEIDRTDKKIEGLEIDWGME